ncbi:MAG: type II toxin-antitoxin system VapC family toxin, partial [Phycisphaerae bacterium]
MTSRLRPRVYLETTIISYLAALPRRDMVVAAHHRITREWWMQQRDKFRLFVSTLVVAEAEKGDVHAAARRLRVMAG